MWEESKEFVKIVTFLKKLNYYTREIMRIFVEIENIKN